MSGVVERGWLTVLDPRSVRLAGYHSPMRYWLVTGLIPALLLTGLAHSLAPTSARADAIDGPPACPPGTRGRSAHEGRWCEPEPCTDDAACGEGSACRAWRVCTQTSMVEPGGLRARPEPAAPRELAVASCDVAEACRGDEEPPPPTVGELQGRPVCSDGRFCVDAALAVFPAGAAIHEGGGEATTTAVGETPVVGSAPSNTPTAPAAAPSSCLCALSSRETRAPISLVVGLVLMSTLAWRRRRS